MNVHIDGSGVEIEKKKGDRILPFHQRGVIAFANGAGNQAAVNGATVHENELLRSRLSAQPRLSDEAANLNFSRRSAM